MAGSTSGATNTGVMVAAECRSTWQRNDALVGKMRVNNFVVPFLFDTGAVKTILDYSVFLELLRHCRRRKRVSSGLSLRAFTGEMKSASGVMRVEGQIQVNLHIGGVYLQNQVILVADLPNGISCLLGRDLIALCPEYQFHFDKLKGAIKATSRLSSGELECIHESDDQTSQDDDELQQDEVLLNVGESWREDQSESEVAVDLMVEHSLPTVSASDVETELSEVLVGGAQVMLDDENVISICPVEKLAERIADEVEQVSEEVDQEELALRDEPKKPPLLCGGHSVESGLGEKEIERLRQDIKNELSTISAKTMKELTPSQEFRHVIELAEPNQPPINLSFHRRVPFHQRTAFRLLIKELEDASLIKKSKSAWAAPVRLVAKPDGSIRMTINFKRLNDVTKKDAFPLPHIEDLYMQIYAKQVFTKVDCYSGFYQIGMDERSAEYTAFACSEGLFEFTVMPMGLTNSPATFQRTMMTILADFIEEGFVIVFIDDILIMSMCVLSHVIHVLSGFANVFDVMASK